MKILVTGSRGWVDRVAIINWFVQFSEDNPGPHTLIEGGAKGVDDIASHACLALGWKVLTVCANWSTVDGGLRRNVKMLEMGPDLVVAWHKDNSPGTAHCIREARKMGLKVVVFVA